MRLWTRHSGMPPAASGDAYDAGARCGKGDYPKRGTGRYPVRNQRHYLLEASMYIGGGAVVLILLIILIVLILR